MERIIKILMQRDDLTRQEAIECLDDVHGMMEECNYDPEECEDIFESELGLEPDYIMDFLYAYM